MSAGCWEELLVILGGITIPPWKLPSSQPQSPQFCHTPFSKICVVGANGGCTQIPWVLWASQPPKHSSKPLALHVLRHQTPLLQSNKAAPRASLLRGGKAQKQQKAKAAEEVAAANLEVLGRCKHRSDKREDLGAAGGPHHQQQCH